MIILTKYFLSSNTLNYLTFLSVLFINGKERIRVRRGGGRGRGGALLRDICVLSLLSVISVRLTVCRQLLLTCVWGIGASKAEPATCWLFQLYINFWRGRLRTNISIKKRDAKSITSNFNSVCKILIRCAIHVNELHSSEPHFTSVEM